MQPLVSEPNSTSLLPTVQSCRFHPRIGKISPLPLCAVYLEIFSCVSRTAANRASIVSVATAPFAATGSKGPLDDTRRRHAKSRRVHLKSSAASLIGAKAIHSQGLLLRAKVRNSGPFAKAHLTSPTQPTLGSWATNLRQSSPAQLVTPTKLWASVPARTPLPINTVQCIALSRDTALTTCLPLLPPSHLTVAC